MSTVFCSIRALSVGKDDSNKLCLISCFFTLKIYRLCQSTQIQMWNQIEECVEGVKTFAKDSGRFLSVCDKPDTAEFKKIALSCAIGFAIMGGIGYLVKLLFIPINNIILS